MWFNLRMRSNPIPCTTKLAAILLYAAISVFYQNVSHLGWVGLSLLWKSWSIMMITMLAEMPTSNQFNPVLKWVLLNQYIVPYNFPNSLAALGNLYLYWKKEDHELDGENC